MKPLILRPFANESDALTLGGDFEIENHLDKLSLFGSLDLTRDKPGLALAQDLQAILQAAIKQLQADDAAGKLPDAITVIEPDIVKNPFE